MRPSFHDRPNQAEPDVEVNLRDILLLLRRKIFGILLVAGLGGLAFRILISALVPNQFTAAASIIIENAPSGVADLQTLFTGVGTDELSMNTQIQIVSSDKIIWSIVEDLGLDQDPEFNPYLRVPSESILQRAIESITTRDTSEPSPDEIKRAVIDNIIDSLSVDLIPETVVLRISVMTSSPQKSALIANSLAEKYIEHQLDVKRSDAERATIWLAEKAAELKIEFDAAQQAMKEFSSSSPAPTEQEFLLLNAQLNSLRGKLSELLDDRIRLIQRIEILRNGRDTGDTDAVIELADDPRLEIFRTNSEQDEIDFEAFSIALDEILSELNRSVERVDAQVRSIQASIAESEAVLQAQSETILQFQQLEREAEASRIIYEYFLSRLKEASAQAGFITADARILSEALIPVKPNYPNLALVLFAGFFASAIAMSSYHVTILLWRPMAMRSHDVETVCQVPVLSEIPLAPSRSLKRILRYVQRKPLSSLSESLRQLRVSIGFRVPPDSKIFLVTSSVPGEGKTTHTALLAMAYADAGYRVLLVDADARRRALSATFKKSGAFGVSKIFESDKVLSDIVIRVEDFGFDVLLADSNEFSYSALLDSQKLEGILDEMRRNYDVVLLDCPPVLLVAEVRRMALIVDQILFVVRWNSTRIATLYRSMKLLSDVRPKLCGVVVTQVNFRKAQGFGISDEYSSYSYSKYYRE